MEIKVLSISDPETKTKGKGTWQVITVTYEDAKGKREKSLASFGGDVYNDFDKTIRNEQLPIMVDVKVQKEGDFWNWKSATVLGPPDVKNEAGTAARGVGAKAGNWETSEERAVKQRYIVRQSSITNALKFFELSDIKPALADVTSLARQFESFVFGEELDVTLDKSKKSPGRPKKVVDTDTPEGLALASREDII